MYDLQFPGCLKGGGRIAAGRRPSFFIKARRSGVAISKQRPLWYVGRFQAGLFSFFAHIRRTSVIRKIRQ
ncbi:MAG: hypothetical protein WAW37_05045 [Syntrophobacteraceae bacterium]